MQRVHVAEDRGRLGRPHPLRTFISSYLRIFYHRSTSSPNIVQLKVLPERASRTVNTRVYVHRARRATIFERFKNYQAAKTLSRERPPHKPIARLELPGCTLGYSNSCSQAYETLTSILCPSAQQVSHGHLRAIHGARRESMTGWSLWVRAASVSTRGMDNHT